MTNHIHLYCVSNNDETLTKNLLSSPDIVEKQVSITILRNARSASDAYYTAIKHAKADILIFAHQDIFFPKGWFSKIETACQCLNRSDPSWAVAGLFGVAEDGKYCGHVWDSALGFVCGGNFGTPRVAVSLDEVVLVLRRASGISFDPKLPSFHLYGTDIVLEARRQGQSSYILDLPVVHNTKPIVRLDKSYFKAYLFMVRKWKSTVPWPTVIVPLSRNPLHFLKIALRVRYKGIFRKSTLCGPLDRPSCKASELGYQ